MNFEFLVNILIPVSGTDPEQLIHQRQIARLAIAAERAQAVLDPIRFGRVERADRGHDASLAARGRADAGDALEVLAAARRERRRRILMWDMRLDLNDLTYRYD